MTQLVVGTKVQHMFGTIAGRYDRANTVLSFGIHHWWRRRFFKLLPCDASLRVLDLCTGTGDLLPELSRRYAQVMGIDFSFPMLTAGKAKWETNAKVGVIQGDALNLPLADNSLDLITVAFGVRNFESLQKGLREIHRVLAPGGKLWILEFGQPEGKMWGGLFRIYSNYIMPLIGGVLTGNKAAYHYLPRTSQLFPCRESFIDILAQAGFEHCSWEALTSGVAYIYGAQAR